MSTRRHHDCIVAALITLTLPAAAAAQAADDEAEHEALRQIKAVVETAISQNDLDQLRPLLDEHFSIVTYTNKSFSDFDAFKAQWQVTREAALGDGTYSVELLPQRSLIFGEIVVAMGDSANVLTTGSGKRHEFSSHWTAVLRKDGDGWKIVRAQSTLNPFANPMLESGVRGMIARTAIIAVIAGVVIGYLIHGLLNLRRRRAPSA